MQAKDKELLKSIHKGVHKANRDYSSWSGGEWIRDAGIEGFMVSRIAESIMASSEKPGFLTMETPFHALCEDLNIRPRGRRPKTFKDTNRIDIALYNKRGHVSHIIEAKRNWCMKCLDDIDRLCQFCKKTEIRKITSVFVMSIAIYAKITNSKDILDNVFDKYEDIFTSYINKKDLPYEFSRGTEFCNRLYYGDSEDKTWIFSSFCILIKPSANSN